ncbi:MAG TPA: carbohydrate binding domain-containing protein, partial [Candidatus Sulfotelmatobacter sp.]|nr:carbohydrate binding domain-containing protein [Candidatus Sulfotelmatobacter sp.]
MKITVWRVATCLGLVLSIAATSAAEPELLPGGEMEGSFVNGLAPGWVSNCYGSNEVVFAQESTEVHRGKSAQRVTCTHFDTGGVQFHSADIAVEKGKPYTLRLWLKGNVRTPVYVGLRKHGAPYTAYLQREVRVKNDWTPCLIMGQASDADPHCGLYLMFTGTGTLLVDDASLKPGLHEEAIRELGGPLQKGNRLYNSGFEAGPEGWTPVNGFALDDQVTHSGRRSARLEATQLESVTTPLNRPLPPNFKPRTASVGIECRPFPVRPGQRYTLSAWIKAAEPNTRVRLQLFEWADRGGDAPENRHQRETTITATTEWARYQLSGILLPNFCEGYVARLVPSSTVWLDDVQVEEGETTAYQPAHPLEAGAETPTRWCHLGETVEVTAWAAAAALQSDAIALNYTLDNLWSHPLKTLRHQVKPGQPDHARFTMEQPGMYRVRVQANDSPATGELWFGVFPEREARLLPDSPFGTHVTSVMPQPSNPLLASAAVGARWVRLHDFG